MSYTRRLLSFLTCALILSAGSRGQTFYRTFGTNTANEGGNTMVASPDGNFFVGGYRGDSALIMKVDPYGALIWARTFIPEDGYSDVVWQLEITADNYLIGCGNGLESNATRNIFYFKLDLEGNVSWFKRSSDPRPTYVRALLPKSSSQYVLINDIYDLNSSTFADPVDQGVSAVDGSIIWTSPRYDYIPGSPYIDDVYAGVLGRGQHIYTTGRTYITNGSPSSMRPFISKSDPNGELLWTKYYVASASESARVYGIDLIYDSDSLMMCYFGDIDQYSSNYRVGLIRTDTLGNFVWGKDYQISDFSSELSFKVLKMPYGYAITGYGIGSPSNDLFAIAVSKQGELIWAKGFGSDVDNEDLVSTVTKNAVSSGSDLLFTGRKTSGANTDLLLVRVDADGGMACSEQYDLDISVVDVPDYTESLDPVPLNDNIDYASASAAAWSSISDVCASSGQFLGPDTATCAPLTLDASSTNATSYLWQDGSTQATCAADTSGIYWVQVTVDCCVISDTVIVSPAADPTSSFMALLDPCSLEVTFQNTSVNAINFTWDFGDGQSSSSTEPTHTYSGGGEYSVTLDGSSACGSDTSTLEIQLSDIGSFAVIGPDSICPDQESWFVATLSNDDLVSIQWSNGISDTDSLLFSTSSDVVLTANATGTNGCAYSQAISIHVEPLPQAEFDYETESCDSSVTFTDQSINATDRSWQLGNGSSSTLLSPTTTYTIPGSFEVQLIVFNGCGTDTASAQLELGPTGSFDIAGPTMLCPNVLGTFSAALSGADITTIQWSTGMDADTLEFSTPVDVILVANVVGSDGCPYADSIPITVLPGPEADFGILQRPCDSTVLFTDSSTLANSWHWSFGNGDTSVVSDPVFTYTQPGAYSVQLIIAGQCGTDTITRSLSIGATGNFAIHGPTSICDNEQVDYSAFLSGAGITHIQWSTGDTTSTIGTVVDDDMILHATVTGSDGCLYTDTLVARVIGTSGISAAYVPNVFTPNGDGINENFSAVILDGFIELMVFNRWGEEIFRTTDVNQAWDGTYKDVQVPDGTYVYLVKWKDHCKRTTEMRYGCVTVLR